MLSFDARGNFIDAVDSNDSPLADAHIASIRKCSPFTVVSQFSLSESSNYKIELDFR